MIKYQVWKGMILYIGMPRSPNAESREHRSTPYTNTYWIE
jgi:hypothetical protein